MLGTQSGPGQSYVYYPSRIPRSDKIAVRFITIRVRGRMNNHKSSSPSPTQPRNRRKVSQRGLLSLAMLLFSLSSLGIAAFGGAKIVLDVFGKTSENADILTKIIVIGLAYGVGWLTAMVAIRVYGNLVLPMLINWFTWGCLAAVCFLYVQILQRLYVQEYEFPNFVKYVMVMLGGLGAMVGLHLIIEEHDLRPFSIPLLIINLFHLTLIVYRYVFTTTAKAGYLWMDLLFFFGMSAFAIATLAHFGILEPLRNQITNYFDRNSTSIRSQD